MPAKINIAKGTRFFKLVVIGEAGKARDGKYLCRCICDCGNETLVRASLLIRGKTKSCGCYRKEFSFRHGMKGTPTHSIWMGMFQRCNNPRNALYGRYGARGISICQRWTKFENFLADMGVRPEGLSLDRINVNGNYEPSNCRWATQEQQSRNTRKQLDADNGIRRSTNGKKYVAYIGYGNKYHHVGTYETLDEARAARKIAEASWRI